MPKKPLILVVNHDESIRSAARTGLEAAGLEVQEAVDGISALAAAAERRHDVVILDQNLPDVPGFELCGRLRAEGGAEHLPILIEDHDVVSALGRRDRNASA